MKKFSKLFWVALVVVAVLACTALGVFAAEAENSTAVVYGETVKAADSFSVNFNFKKDKDTKVECGKITLTWDSNKMSATSIDAADGALSGAQFGSKIEEGKAVIAWAGSDISATEGTLFTVNFANKDIAADGYATVNVSVDNFGYTEGFFAKELKNDVKQSGAVVTGEEFDGNMTYDANTTDTPKEFLEEAIELSAAGDVTVKLAKDMVFSADTVVGAYLTEAPAHKITVKSELEADSTAPKYGIEIAPKVVVTLNGEFVFEDVKVWVAYTDADLNKYHNIEWTRSQGSGFLFPDYALGVFEKNIITPAHTFNYTDGDTQKTKDIQRKINLAGNVTLKTGDYAYVAGNFDKPSKLDEKGNVVEGKGPEINGANITMSGNATAVCVFGGGMEAGAAVTGKTTIKILDSSSVSDTLVGGSRYSGNSGTSGADILVNTTGTIKTLIVGCLDSSYTKAAMFNLYMLKGAVTYLTSMRTNGGNSTTLGVEDTVINMYIDGGTINKTRLGFYNNSGSDSLTASSTVNFYLNYQLTGEEKHAIYGDEEYGGLATITEFYGGSQAYGNEKQTDAMTKNIYIKDGVFGTFYGGSIFVKNNSSHTGSTNYVIENATFNNETYFGSLVYKDGNSYVSNCNHSGATTVEIKYATFNKALYGGSSIKGGSENIHSGTVDVTIKGGYFKESIYAGSNLASSGAIHDKKGTVTLTIQPSNGKSFTFPKTKDDGITKYTGKHIICGSNVSSGAEHKSDTTLYIKDFNCWGTSGTNGQQSWFCNGGVVAAGSQLNNGTHSGNSKMIIQRSGINEHSILVGGSRMDGNTSLHSGTSKLVFDANTGLVNGEEVVGQNGFASAYQAGGAGWFGGSYVNGYNTNPSNIKQTGESSVELIAPEDSTKTLTLRGAEGASVCGGDYFVSSRPIYAQQHDSYVTIKGKVLTGNVSAGDSGESNVSIVGGAYYSTRKFEYSEDSFVPTTRVIVDGEFSGRVIGGFNSKYNGEISYKNNSAVTLKSGSVKNGIFITGWSRTSAYTKFVGTQEGTCLLEVYNTYVDDNEFIGIDELDKLTLSGSYNLKLIGKFKDGSDSDNKFGLSTNLTFSNNSVLDVTQADGPNLILSTKTDAAATTSTHLSFDDKGGTLERILSYKSIYFAKPGTTLSSVSDVVPASKQVDVNPSMTVADLLATEGLRIFNQHNSAAWNKIYDYSEYTQFDRLSSSPNAFKLYTVGEDGKTPVEEITQIPADPSQKIIVKSGITYSSPTYLTRHELRFATAAIEFAENLAVTLRIKAPTLNSYGYSDYYLKATINGVTTTVTDYTVEADGRYKFVFSDIPPYLMAHDMDIVLFAKYDNEDVTALNLDYGIYSYARSRLDKSTNDKYKSVIVDMLNYGNAAQIYKASQDAEFVYSKLATEAAGITEEEQTLYATSNLRPLNNKQDAEYTTINNPTAAFKGITLYFGSTVQVEYRFLPNTTINPENLKVKLINSANNHEYDEFIYEDFEDAGYDKDGNWKGYKVTIDELYANQMSDVILATVYDGDTPISNTLSYSIETYVSKKLTSTDTKFVDLISTMMKYGDSVVAYSTPSN